VKFIIRKEDMLPAQREWWELDNFIPLLVGGMGAGKTYIGALQSLYLSNVNRGLPGQYISPSYQMARRTIEATLIDVMDRSGIQYNFNKTIHEFRIHSWDGIIWIGSGDDPNSLRGPNLAWVGIDEPFVQDEMVMNIAISRVRHPAATLSKIFLTGTPEELNWGYELTEGSEDVGLVVASTRDNKHLPAGYVDRLERRYSKNMALAYIDGKFVNMRQGLVYEPFSRESYDNGGNVTTMQAPGAKIIAGMDFNVSKMCCCVGWLLPDGIHWFDEIVQRDSDTFKMAKALSEAYPRCTVYPDPAGSGRHSSSTKSDHQILRDFGLHVIAPRSHPQVKDRVNAVNGLWRNAAGKARMTVDPKCKEIIADMERVQWHNGEPDKRQEKQGRVHMSDAVGYPVSYIFPVLRRTMREVPR